MTHLITGFKYLGQTTRDLNLYYGSSRVFTEHCKEWGFLVEKEVLLETTDPYELAEQGRYYSKLWNVVDDPNDEYIDHIDCWGKFLSPQKVLIREVPTSHAQYDEIEEIVDYFEEVITPSGEPLEIFRVYTPNDQPYTNSLIFKQVGATCTTIC